MVNGRLLPGCEEMPALSLVPGCCACRSWLAPAGPPPFRGKMPVSILYTINHSGHEDSFHDDWQNLSGLQLVNFVVVLANAHLIKAHNGRASHQMRIFPFISLL